MLHVTSRWHRVHGSACTPMQIAVIHLTSVVTWPTVTAACFQGGAASAGVRPHRPADHGAARAAGIPGSSGRTASAPVRVSRKYKH